MNTQPNVTQKNIVSLSTLPSLIRGLKTINSNVPTNQKQALLILGPVGVGKSQIPVQVANEDGDHVVVINLVNYLPSEVTGWTTQVGNEMAQLKPRWFTELEAAASAGKNTVLIFEEFCQCDQDVQSAAAQIILDRRVAGNDLPDNCLIVANGNRKEDKANVRKMPQQVVSRFCIVEVGVEHQATLDYFQKTDVATEVVAFLNFSATSLHNVGEQDGTPFPTPRSWEAVSNIVKAKLAGHVQQPLIDGRIGRLEGTAFSGFLKMFDKLQSPAEILANPSGVPIAEELDVQHAQLGSCIAYASSKQGDALATWLGRVGDANQELLGVAIQQIKRRNEVTPEKKITSPKLTELMVKVAALLHGDD